tara:strand:- start:11605 stop:15792 length:4188 start_codon:yes stop_codon:yes gene_type:complete
MAYKKIIGNYQSNADFSPNLVGYQVVEGQLTLLSTFYTTSTTQPKTTEYYNTQNFSQPITLNTLSITQTESAELLENNLKLVLNLDKSDLFHYTLFGSLREHIKSSITNIIKKWPASLYVGKYVSGSTLNTVLEYEYNDVEKSATFKVPVSAIQNNFLINIKENPNIFQGWNGIKMMSKDFYKYDLVYPVDSSVSADGTYVGNSPGFFSNTQEHPVLKFTGTSPQSPNYVYFTVKGNPFTGSTLGVLSDNFHIKPKTLYREKFFNKLGSLDGFLLNRNITPMFTSEFMTPIETSTGTFTLLPKKFTWPTTDGYNIDINTTIYGKYITELLKLADSYDEYKTDLVSRFFTTDAIKEFDTDDRRVQKLLRIYGREFDEVKKYIDGIAYANRVSYNKSNNIPDRLTKNFARTLGFETIDFSDQSKVMEAFFGGTNETVFSGTSVGMTPVQFDIELWRRIVINAGYLYKSKGTRKIIEFFLRFIGAPTSLIDFNEYVYTTKGKLNTNQVGQALTYLLGTSPEGETSLYNGAEIPMDTDGYPEILPPSDDYYFQMRGGWYQTTRHNGANNPHMGPYDAGQDYFNKFRCFTDITGQTINVASQVTGTVPADTLVAVLVSNQAGNETNFLTIKNNLGYTSSRGEGGIGAGDTPGPCDPNSPLTPCSWNTVSDAINYGNAAVFVFEHIGADIPVHMQQLAKDLYDAGYAVLTISNEATNSLYPIGSVSDHMIGEEWGFTENPILDPLNPLSQNWTSVASTTQLYGENIDSVIGEATILAYNDIPNETKINTAYLYNTNGGRWVHSQNPRLYDATDLLTNIMDFLTMRSEQYRDYFNFDWPDNYEEQIYVACPGFTLYPQVDNKKSWIVSSGQTLNADREWSINDSDTGNTNTYRDTLYYVGDDERLVLNTKMVDAHLNVAKGIEQDMYAYNKLSGFPITLKFDYNENINENLWPVASTGRGYNRQNLGKYDSTGALIKPQNLYYGSSLSAAGFTVSATTFAQYIDNLKTKFINVKNRKTIGGGGFGFQPNWPAYPTLRNLYESYVSGGTSSTVLGTGVQVVNNLGSNQFTYKKMIGFVDKIEPYWSSLIEQFIPSTTILGLGTKYRNTVFDRQKYVYKHGQNSVMEIEDLSNESMLINPQVDSIGDTLNNNTGSQWHNKTVLYSAMIGPWYSNDTTEPLVLRDSDGGPGVAPVGTPTVALVTGKDYYFRIGVKFISGMQNVGGTNIGDQVSYSVGGLIADPAQTFLGWVPGVGYVSRQGRIFLKTAISALKDVEILAFGPGFYDVRFTPLAGANTQLHIVTDINGLIIDSVKLYNVTDSIYICDTEVRNGNFTNGMEHYDAMNNIDQNRVQNWSGLSGSGAPAANTKKWQIAPTHFQVWPGSDGTESATIMEWYERGLIDDVP